MNSSTRNVSPALLKVWTAAIIASRAFISNSSPRRDRPVSLSTSGHEAIKLSNSSVAEIFTLACFTPVRISAMARSSNSCQVDGSGFVWGCIPNSARLYCMSICTRDVAFRSRDSASPARRCAASASSNAYRSMSLASASSLVSAAMRFSAAESFSLSVAPRAARLSCSARRLTLRSCAKGRISLPRRTARVLKSATRARICRSTASASSASLMRVPSHSGWANGSAPSQSLACICGRLGQRRTDASQTAPSAPKRYPAGRRQHRRGRPQSAPASFSRSRVISGCCRSGSRTRR